MWGKGTTEEFTFNPEIERTLRAKQGLKFSQASALEVKETLTDESMDDQNNPPLQPREIMGDYCRRTNTKQVSIGFGPTNPVNFNIKGNVLN
jgi:hypothetical protein